MAQSINENFSQQPKPPKYYARLFRKLRFVKWATMVGGLLFLCGGAFEFYRTSQLQKHGVKIEGTLFDISMVATGKGRTSYDVIVDYDPVEMKNGIRKRFNVTEAQFNEITRTGKTTLTYLPSDPTLSAVGDEVAQDMETFALGIGLFLIGVGIHVFTRRQMSKVEAYIRGEPV